MTNTTNGELAIVGTLGALVLGCAAGFAAGWLSAPASGRETRRWIGRRIDDERDEIVRRSQRALNRAADQLERGVSASRRRFSRSFAA